MADSTDQLIEGFSWELPTAFTATLAKCRFERGDVLYERGKGNGQTRMCIQVREPAQGGARATSEAGVFEMNWQSPVVFWAFKVAAGNYEKVREITTTQGRLYMLLWKNNWDLLDSNRECPVPMTFLEASRQAESVAGEIKNVLAGTLKYPNIWVMGYDPTNPVSQSKFKAVSTRLNTEFSARIRIFNQEEVGLRDAFIVPTLSFAAFAMDMEESGGIVNSLKEVLYKPVAERKTAEDKFRLSAHGAFLPWRQN